MILKTTSYLSTNYGIKQGYVLALFLFSMILLSAFKQSDKGIQLLC